MWARLLICIFALISTPALAEESCGMRAAKLFANDDLRALSSLFAGEASALSALKSMRAETGSIKNLVEASTARFPRHTRLSYAPNATAGAAIYAGNWVNADSEKLGPVQFHVASKMGGGCELLAFHIDSKR